MRSVAARHSRELVRVFREHFWPDEPEAVVEIGVASGKTSSALLQAFPDLLLWMVDPWKLFPQGARYRNYGDSMAEENRTQADWDALKAAALSATEFAEERRTVMQMTSAEAAWSFPIFQKFDAVFIDGDHSYEGCRDDIAYWHGKVRKGGLIAGHDYGARDFRAGVTRAVNEAAEANGWKINVGSHKIWWAVK